MPGPGAHLSYDTAGDTRPRRPIIQCRTDTGRTVSATEQTSTRRAACTDGAIPKTAAAKAVAADRGNVDFFISHSFCDPFISHSFCDPWDEATGYTLFGLQTAVKPKLRP